MNLLFLKKKIDDRRVCSLVTLKFRAVFPKDGGGLVIYRDMPQPISIQTVKKFGYVKTNGFHIVFRSSSDTSSATPGKQYPICSTFMNSGTQISVLMDVL